MVPRGRNAGALSVTVVEDEEAAAATETVKKPALGSVMEAEVSETVKPVAVTPVTV